MVICFIALGVFAVLGLVSAKYRTYFFEALDCVTKKVTLRKCTTSFDKKMKMKVSAKLSQVHKGLGSFVFKHFDFISWVITILMIISLIVSAYFAVTGFYNWYAYGNCNGPDSNAACVYNALVGKNTPVLGTSSDINKNNYTDLNICLPNGTVVNTATT